MLIINTRFWPHRGRYCSFFCRISFLRRNIMKQFELVCSGSDLIWKKITLIFRIFYFLFFFPIESENLYKYIMYAFFIIFTTRVSCVLIELIHCLKVLKHRSYGPANCQISDLWKYSTIRSSIFRDIELSDPFGLFDNWFVKLPLLRKQFWKHFPMLIFSFFTTGVNMQYIPPPCSPLSPIFFYDIHFYKGPD